MRTVALTLSDTVTIDNSGLLSGAQGSIVGSGAIWKDNSDATYAALVTQMHGAGQPQFGSTASSAITTGDLSTVNEALATVFFRIRVAALEGGLPYPNVNLTSPGRSSSSEDTLTGACPTAPTTVDIPITTVPASFWTDVSTYSANVSSAFQTGGNGEKFWNVHEVSVFVTIPGADAPPCRIFPRSDGLGVGAGRNYPPPKSQQRSSRGVGYY